MSVGATDTTGIISVAGSLAGGQVGVGIGADAGVVTKDTEAYVASGVTATVPGNIIVDAESSESLISVSAGLGAGEVGVSVNAGIHVFSLTTLAFIDDAAGHGFVHATGSIAVTANDAGDINEIVGVLAAGGVGVGAAVGVDVSTKTTKAYLGQNANVEADGQGAGITVDTGAITTGITAAPTFVSGAGAQFASSAVSTGSGQINLGTSSGLRTGDRVAYSKGNGGTVIGGLGGQADVLRPRYRWRQLQALRHPGRCQRRHQRHRLHVPGDRRKAAAGGRAGHRERQRRHPHRGAER